jgi:hypothetical protein
MPTIVGALLIAFVGFVANWVLSSVSSRQQSARLITELQIKREEADILLRKDIFDKTLEAFLLKNQDIGGTLKDMSKQLLRLELLALNFGDSLSLAPLFVEIRNDLERSKPVKDEERSVYKWRKAELRKRLESLAKRVASTQVSSLSQHGKIKPIRIPLYEIKEDDPCQQTLFEDTDFKWPDHKILGIMEVDNFKKIDGSEEGSKIFKDLKNEMGLIELNGVKRYLELSISNVNPCKKTAKVQIIIYKDDPQNPEVNETFRLDYFNFPTVDNTRLSDNQRFAIIMEDFKIFDSDPRIDIIGIVFPSEYASLRDRPGMQEARKLLEAALEN